MAELNMPTMQKTLWWAAVVTMAVFASISSSDADIGLGLGLGRHSWERPGCHKVGKLCTIIEICTITLYKQNIIILKNE